MLYFFLSADNRCTNGCTAVDEQQGNPQSKVACIASLGKFGIVFQLRRYGVGFFHRFLFGLFLLLVSFGIPLVHYVEERGEVVILRLVTVHAVIDCNKAYLLLGEQNLGIKADLKIVSAERLISLTIIVRFSRLRLLQALPEIRDD